MRQLRSRLAPTLSFALVSALITALVSGCASLTQSWIAPEVALAGLRIKELTLLRQVFIVTLTVKNPNDRTLPIKSMTYRLKLEGNELAQGSSRLDRQIPPLGTAPVEVEVVSSLLGITQQLPALALKDRPLDWTVSGTASLANGLLPLPYRWSGQIDAKALLSTMNGGSPRVQGFSLGHQ
jgi:LEA14-like dessication related protein